MEVLPVPLDYPSLLFSPFGTRVSSLFCQNISLFFRSSICCSSVKFELPFNCSIMVISTSSKLRPCRTTWRTRSQNCVCFFLAWFLWMLNLIYIYNKRANTVMVLELQQANPEDVQLHINSKELRIFQDSSLTCISFFPLTYYYAYK